MTARKEHRQEDEFGCGSIVVTLSPWLAHQALVGRMARKIINEAKMTR